MVVACNPRPFICNTRYAQFLCVFFCGGGGGKKKKPIYTPQKKSTSTQSSTPITSLLPLNSLQPRVLCINNWLIGRRGVCFDQQTRIYSVHIVGICVTIGTVRRAGEDT